MDIAELSRRLENLIRIGIVAEVDHAARRVRVDSGGLQTDWLKWCAGRAGATRTWSPPTVGEQVMILSPSGELANGIVMPSIYSDSLDTPSDDSNLHIAEFPDGARITYNHATGALTASGIQTATIQAEQRVTIDCPATRITGTLEVDELVIAHAGVTNDGGVIQSHGIVLDSHRHSGVQPSNGNSGGPL